jgi:hypothetical protein
MNDFSIESINESAFEKAMVSEFWGTKTWKQAAKDFALSGISDFPMEVPEGLDKMINLLSKFMSGLQSKSQNRDSLNYRVDLPVSLHTSEMAFPDYARIILFRSFQKVWLRRKFSNPSKEGMDDLL